MILDGKLIASQITDQLQKEVEELKQKGKTPKIVIITVGGEEAWKTYVGQKMKLADKLGIEKELIPLQENEEDKLLKTIEQCNNDNNVSGMIVQRPIPKSMDREKVTNAILPSKDIDGFRDDSNFKSPIWLAILEFLRVAHEQLLSLSLRDRTERSEGDRLPAIAQTSVGRDGERGKVDDFDQWLRSQTWVIIGKGETGGRPTIIELKKLGIEPLVIDSKTQNPHEIIKQGDIIITGVGKRVVEAQDVKKGAILIGIGIRREADGKLYGDYNEEEIKDIAGAYTPTPGGVGPLNLAFLFKNLVEAAKKMA